MNEYERITNAAYHRRIHPHPLHHCHTSGCLNLVAGDDYCARCADEMAGQPYTFANILGEMPKWARRLFWTTIIVAAFVLSILLILL